MKTFIKYRSKKAEYYKDILIKADTGLHDDVMSVLRKSVPESAVILDMGAGEGAMSQRLFDSGYEVTATDIEERHFKAKGPKFHQIDFNDVDSVNEFAERHINYFDAVLSIEVIEHIENQWEYVRLMKKMLKIGGKIVVTTPNVSSWLSRFYFLFTGQFPSFNNQTADEYGHVSPISVWELNLILKREGFQNINISKGGFLPSIWITRNVLILISVMLSPFVRPFMSGHSQGWCIIAVGEK